MELQQLELTQLKTAAINVRKKGAKDIDDLVPSIKSLGLLQPLLVRKNCEGYEVVAGQRRYHALLKLAEEQEVIEPVPCIIMQEDDDIKAIEVSLAENVARLPMDEIDQYKAFSTLSKKGLSVEDIATQFGITRRLVQQRLALGNLHPPILTAFRNEEISADTLRILTMATPKQQKEWLALAKGKHGAPQGYRLKQWLFGGKSIPTVNALFDLKEYKGNIVSDLFGDENYFDDPEQFWELQNQAIASVKEELLSDGWNKVSILEVGEYFPSYDYIDTPKEEEGNVYIHIAHDGEVTIHKGLLTRKEAKARQKANSNAQAVPVTRPELTKPMQNYLALHRHSAVRTELLKHSDIALRLAVAQIIASSELWEIHADPQNANSDQISDSLASNKAESLFAKEHKEVMSLLDIPAKSNDTLVLRKTDWVKSRDLHTIFAMLLKLSHKDVTRILSFVTAETLPSSSAMVEFLGEKLKVDMSRYWRPDDTFFDLHRDKQAINAMLKEVAGKPVADGNITATAKVQKQIIKDCLNGSRNSVVKDWQPSYMQFPMKAYTDREGIQAIEQRQNIKVNFDN